MVPTRFIDIGTGGVGAQYQGWSCSLSADGNTLAVGGYNNNSGEGATWIFTRSFGGWSQQDLLVGTGGAGAQFQGQSCSLSADGNTLSVGGFTSNGNQGATWIFTRSCASWSQQDKLVGTGNTGAAQQGTSCSLSANGNTLAVGGPSDNSSKGATWIFI